MTDPPPPRGVGVLCCQILPLCCWIPLQKRGTPEIPVTWQCDFKMIQKWCRYIRMTLWLLGRNSKVELASLIEFLPKNQRVSLMCLGHVRSHVGMSLKCEIKLYDPIPWWLLKGTWQSNEDWNLNQFRIIWILSNEENIVSTIPTHPHWGPNSPPFYLHNN